MIGDKISSYTVIVSTEIGNAKFVVGENTDNEVAPYATWQANIKNNPHDYFWGHYFSGKEDALVDYGERITCEAKYQQGYAHAKAGCQPHDKSEEER